MLCLPVSLSACPPACLNWIWPIQNRRDYIIYPPSKPTLNDHHPQPPVPREGYQKPHLNRYKVGTTPLRNRARKSSFCGWAEEWRQLDQDKKGASEAQNQIKSHFGKLISKRVLNFKNYPKSPNHPPVTCSVEYLGT